MPSFTSRHQLVAHAPHGEDVLGHGGVRLDLRAEAPDVDVHEAAVAEVVVPPHAVEQLLAAEHPVRAAAAGRRRSARPARPRPAGPGVAGRGCAPPAPWPRTAW